MSTGEHLAEYSRSPDEMAPLLEAAAVFLRDIKPKPGTGFAPVEASAWRAILDPRLSYRPFGPRPALRFSPSHRLPSRFLWLADGAASNSISRSQVDGNSPLTRAHDVSNESLVRGRVASVDLQSARWAGYCVLTEYTPAVLDKKGRVTPAEDATPWYKYAEARSSEDGRGPETLLGVAAFSAGEFDVYSRMPELFGGRDPVALADQLNKISQVQV